MRLAILALATATALPAAQPLRVLFIGNSYTYYNNLPEIFAALARAAAPDREVEARMVTIGGQTLLHMYERSKARDEIRSGKWDYVVLQEHSLLGGGLRDGREVVNGPAMLRRGARLFAADIERAGAKTVMTLTWSRKAAPELQPDLDYAYDSVARELKAILVPAGPAWQQARRENIAELYQADGSHPSAAGSYLLACLLVNTLVKADAADLPREVTGHPVSGGRADMSRTAPIVSLGGDEATAFQRIARMTVAEQRNMGGYRNAKAPKHPLAAVPTASSSRDFNGQWAGELVYFDKPAKLTLSVTAAGDKCEGDAAITIGGARQRFESPIANCSIGESGIEFRVPAMGLPAIYETFRGNFSDSGREVAGPVERGGLAYAHTMTGSWSVHRAGTR